MRLEKSDMRGAAWRLSSEVQSYYEGRELPRGVKGAHNLIRGGGNGAFRRTAIGLGGG